MHTNIKLNDLPDHAIALLVSGGHTELIELKVKIQKAKVLNTSY